MKSKAKPRKIMKHDEPPLHKFSQKQQISKKKMKKNINKHKIVIKEIIYSSRTDQISKFSTKMLGP